MKHQESRADFVLARPEVWLEEHGDYLYRFALARVKDADTAEDLVQETLLAGLNAAATFAGQSSERTWLTGILKNKWLDWLRKTQRARLVADLNGQDDGVDSLYDRWGHWKIGPREWREDPVGKMDREEFWEAFRRCSDRLPDRLREVFFLRHVDALPAKDVCQAFEISATNLWTLLHRARVRLWRCLDRNGFGSSTKE